MGKLGIYLLANYPSKEVFLEAVQACQDLGVDFLEVGFPFSDPVADGDALEKAGQVVLKRGDGMDDFVESFKRARAIFQRDLYIMTYSNLVYSMGIATFAKRVGPCNGLILADLPLREIASFEKGLKSADVPIIRFLTPESREEDITSALKGAKGFVYFVSKRGTTGGGFDLDEETREKIAHVRGRGVDVCIGFGIQSKRDFDLACSAADGAIIGTKAVAELEKGIEAFKVFLKALKE